MRCYYKQVWKGKSHSTSEVMMDDLSVGDFVVVGANEARAKSHIHYVCIIERINKFTFTSKSTSLTAAGP